MVGDVLDSQAMQDICHVLKDLKNPWVCAHGRPTMRYLFDTVMIS
jgi:DNA mismatch repair ATPase MutL